MNPFRLLRLNEPRTHGFVMVVIFLLLGLGLCFQSFRFSNTPSYANLLDILRAQVWGALYLLAATALTTCMWTHVTRPLVIVSHTYAMALLIVWEIAFIIRYFTDVGTTVVNILSWGAFMYLTSRSAAMLDDHIGLGERE